MPSLKNADIFKREYFQEIYFIFLTQDRSSRSEVFLKFSQNSLENTCVRVSFSIKLQASAYNFIKKETLAQFCEFCKNLRAPIRSSHLEVFLEKGVLKYAANLQKNTHADVLHIFRTPFTKNTSGGCS